MAPSNVFLLVVPFGLFLAAGLIVLQIFLSGRPARWPGLVLPVLSFLASLAAPLSMAAPPGGGGAALLVPVLAVFLLGNLPTALFLALYLGCRRRYRRKAQLNKMRIHDLE